MPFQHQLKELCGFRRPQVYLYAVLHLLFYIC